MKAPAGRRLRHLNMSIELRPLAPHTEPGLETCPRAGAVERESDLKLLEAAPGGGGGTLSRGKVLVPKALDADDDEDAESDSSDDDDEARAAPRAGHARRGCLCCGRGRGAGERRGGARRGGRAHHAVHRHAQDEEAALLAELERVKKRAAEPCAQECAPSWLQTLL